MGFLGPHGAGLQVPPPLLPEHGVPYVPQVCDASHPVLPSSLGPTFTQPQPLKRMYSHFRHAAAAEEAEAADRATRSPTVLPARFNIVLTISLPPNRSSVGTSAGVRRNRKTR